ncbi:MAG: hypothetical protein Q9213_001218 [Squamulea squamosa]
MLLEFGADVGEQSETCGSILEIAAAQGDLEIVKLLLDFGADINQKGVKHISALQASSSHGHVKVVQYLLDQGAELHPTTLPPLASASGVHASGGSGNERLRREQPDIQIMTANVPQPANPLGNIGSLGRLKSGLNPEPGNHQRKLQDGNNNESEQDTARNKRALHSGQDFSNRAGNAGGAKRPCRNSRGQPIEAQSKVDKVPLKSMITSQEERDDTEGNTSDEYGGGYNLGFGSAAFEISPLSDDAHTISLQSPPPQSPPDDLRLRVRQGAGTNMLLQADNLPEQRLLHKSKESDPVPSFSNNPVTTSQALETTVEALKTDEHMSSLLALLSDGDLFLLHDSSASPSYESSPLRVVGVRNMAKAYNPNMTCSVITTYATEMKTPSIHGLECTDDQLDALMSTCVKHVVLIDLETTSGNNLAHRAQCVYCARV